MVIDNIYKTQFYISKVVSAVDDNKGARIKAKIPVFDRDKSLDEIPFAFPLLPKLIQIPPKVGEAVLIMLQEQGAVGTDRFYIGPLVAQPQYLEECSYEIGKSAIGSGGGQYFLPNPDMDETTWGSLPEEEDVALQGRFNSDIILKDNQLQLRCGFIKRNTNLTFNKTSPAYIQMRYDKFSSDGNINYDTVINVVADRINLVTHDNIEDYQLTTPYELITKTDIETIVNTSHPLVYGDKLKEFLEKIMWAISNHKHKMANETAYGFAIDTMNDLKLDDMLSKTVTTT